MIGKVIKSKALYGRINIELKIGFLPTLDSAQFFNKNKANTEIFKYLITLGGTPKYLSDLKPSRSYEENIAQMFFSRYSGYITEFEKIFYSQFKEHKIYHSRAENFGIYAGDVARSPEGDS
jgi:hypothetical protein